MSRIIIETGPSRGRSFTLPEKGAMGIGRDEKCAIRLDDQMASRIHCVLRFVDGGWRLEDRQSLNGTHVNDVRVGQRRLVPGDMIQVGETLLTFLAEEIDPLIGQTLGGCKIAARLGRGATGTVYRAVQLSLDRPVALKILAPRFAHDEEFIGSFLDEARSAARLNHPHVVQVYDAGQDGDHYYISMEYLEGGTLEERRLREGQIPPDEAVAAAIDAAKALAFAEQHEIVHRDIKPANLLFTADDTVKVCDLGIAVDLGLGSGQSAEKVAGSPRYMAPEQACGGSIDHRADIYALGGTLYCALAGHPPFDGASFREVIQAKLERDPEPLKRLAPDVPLLLSDVVQRMLARDPDDRFSSAVEVQKILEKILDRMSGPRRRRRRGGRRRALSRPVAPRPRPKRGAPEGRAAAPRGPRPRHLAPRAEAPNTTPVGLVAAAGIGVLLLVVGLVALSSLNKDSPSSERFAGAPSKDRLPDGPAVSPEREAPGRTPGRDPKSAAGRTLKEAVAVHRDWSQGKLDRSRAEERLRSLLAETSEASVRSSIERSLEAIREASRLEAEKAAGEINAKIKTLIGEGRLTEAAAALDEFERKFPDQLQLVAPSRQACDKAVSAVVGKASKEVEELVEKGAFSAARAKIDVLAGSVSSAGNEDVAKLRANVTEAERALEAATKALQAARASVRLAVANLDFERAERLIDEAVGGWSTMEERAAKARRDIQLARQVWSGLEKFFQEAVQSRKAVSLKFQPSPVPALLGAGEDKSAVKPKRFRVLSLDGSVLELHLLGSKAPPQVRAVLAVEAGTLLSLLKPAEASAEGELRQGLGLLVLLRRGPEQARPLLLDAQVDDARRRANQVLLESAANVWLAVRTEAVKGRLAKYEEASPAPSGGAWGFLATDAAELIHASKETPGSAKELGPLYLKAREQALLHLPPADLFHAKETEFLKDGLVRLTYDFSTEAQLQDFVSSKKVGASVDWHEGKKLLQLQGEARFLEGNPFRERIGISAMVASFDVDAPNINVAFWTHEEDGVTVQPSTINLREWYDRGGRTPKDYIVLGMGYLWEVDLERGWGERGRWGRAFLPDYMREPTHVILAGSRGASLHQRRSESIWEEPVKAKLTGPARFEIEMNEGQLRWTFNRRRIGYKPSPKLKQLLEVSQRTGSLSLFSNGHDIYYAKLEIWGQLDPGWVGKRAQVQAKKELAKLEGRPPPTPAPGDRGETPLGSAPPR